jgi:hypothetical protein
MTSIILNLNAPICHLCSEIYEQEFRELAAGFNKELAPAVLKLSEQVNGVSGPMTEQYSQWRKILRDLFKLETQQM